MKTVHMQRVYALRPASFQTSACRVLGLLCLLSAFVAVTTAAAALVDNSLLPLTDEEKSLCGKKLPLAACKLKISKCAPLDTLLAPLLGTPQAIVSCANTTNVPLKADFLAYLGKAMMTGMVNTKLSKKPTDDPLANYAIRQCILNSTGMLSADLQLDRATIAAQVADLSPPSLGAAVGLAVDTCPEPLELKIKGYLKCLKKACLTSIPDPTPSSPSVGSPLAGGTNTWDSSATGGSGGYAGMGAV